MSKKNTIFFIECATVFAFLLLPPLFSTIPFSLPPKPERIYSRWFFYFSTLYAAAYEEVLYRLYTPNRLHRIYNDYIKPRLEKNFLATEGDVCLPLLSFSHKQSRYKKAAVSFEFFLTEFPALLLFTLAHRYIGLFSMLFAAGAGIIFRIAYLKLRHLFSPALSIALVAVVHGLWNISVYYYLWEYAVTV